MVRVGPPGGAFSDVFDAAVSASGLTLDRLRYRLAEHGVDISVATLSYWRRGERRPERPESLRAVRVLERVLGLPEAALLSVLGPPRPRGRWLGERTDPDEVLSARLRDPDEGDYVVVSAQDVFTVGADRRRSNARSRMVVRGVRGTVTRCLVRYQSDDPLYAPELTDARFCEVGAVELDPAVGLLVAELRLDRPLRVGEYAVLEYDMTTRPGPDVRQYYRRLRRPMIEYSQQVLFEGEPPAVCGGFRRATSSGPEQTGPLPVGPSRSSCVVGFNMRPGIVGTRWQW